MHNVELAKKTSFTCINTIKMYDKTNGHFPAKQMFRTWIKTLLHCGFGQTYVNQMTYEPMFSAQAQSLGATKYIYNELITIVASSQEVRINIYFPSIPGQVASFEL